MLRSCKKIVGYNIMAVDETFGYVQDFFFDDEAWRLRYMVVDIGQWFPRRRVLLPPLVLMKNPDWAGRLFPVALTKEAIADAPEVDTDKPVSRRYEEALHAHYGWMPYWTGGGMPPPTLEEPLKENLQKAKVEGDPHLRSMNEVTKYLIHASDGEIGHVHDFVMDDDGWTIRYLVVDTRNWVPGRKVLIAPAWTSRIDWSQEAVHVLMTREEIKKSPKYDPAEPVNRDYELHLYDYYGRPKYWDFSHERKSR